LETERILAISHFNFPVNRLKCMRVSCFSSVSIVTRFRTGGPEYLYLDNLQKYVFFCFVIFIAAVMPTQSSVKWASALLFRQLKR